MAASGRHAKWRRRRRHEAGNRQTAEEKVDIVKIWVDDHLGTMKKMPLEIVKAMIDDAHKTRHSRRVRTSSICRTRRR